MDARYKFYLDGQLFDNPQGWDKWESTIERGVELISLRTTESPKVTFYGAAYQYLAGIRKHGFCRIVQVMVEESCGGSGTYLRVLDGVIFISDVKFSLTKCSAECFIMDDSYSSWIHNNQSVECSINAGKTKNGDAIDRLPVWSVDMFVPCTGNPSGIPNAKAYRAFDVLKYIVNFMTDGRVGFRSSLFDFGGEFEGMMITKGSMIRDPANKDRGILLKWVDVLKNLDSLCGLGWTIDTSVNPPQLVIEKRADIFDSSELMAFQNVNDITRKINHERNYAAVQLGTVDVIESFGCGSPGGLEPAFPDQINLIGCKREQFAVTGVCNIDSILDLSCDWVVSSNVIENIHINGDDRYEDSVIVLDANNLNPTTFTAEAVQGDVFGITPPVFYNARFFNYPVIKRHLRRIPSSLVKYLNYPETAFKASRTGTEVLTSPILYNPYPFGDDFSGSNNDLNNDYGNGTTPGSLITQGDSRYTAPAENVYRFRVTIRVQCNSNTPAVPSMNVTFNRYDSTDTFVTSYTISKSYPVGIFPSEEFDSPLIYLNQGDYVFINITWTAGQSLIQPPQLPSSFELLETGTQGGVFEVFNGEEWINDEYEITTPMALSEFNLIRKNPTKLIRFSDGTNQVSGWIDMLSYSRHTGIARVKLVATTGG